MQHEFLFWSMLAVIVSAIVGGAATGFAASLTKSLVLSLLLAFGLAWGASRLLLSADLTDGVLMLSIAIFMFAWVIASAFSMLTRRVRSKRLVA